MNKVLNLLRIKVPIIQGGMGNISPPNLCTAVSRAGGLGQIGVGNLSLTKIEEKLVEVRNNLTLSESFGVNIPISVHPDVEGVLQLIHKYNVPVVSLSAGNPKPWIDRLKENGIIVMVVVSTVKQALKAEASGADLLIGEGFEAAGKNSPKELTTMTLVPQLVQQVQIPVIAAGGIADGKGLLAALSLGASGVQLGTRLIVTKEAHVHDNYQRAILRSSDEDTTIVGRSYGYVTRLLNTTYAQKVKEAEQNGATLNEFKQWTDEDSHERGALQGLLDEGHINAGQISGAIQDIPSVQGLFQSMMVEAEEQLYSIQKQLNERRIFNFEDFK
jgi:enoyl-[acyl-carrier protein] reductase II